jgi:cold shock CspA family protein
MYQVKWFNKKKGYGFATSETNEEVFCHHTDLKVDGYKYLKRGEFVRGEVTAMADGKSKLANIRAPMDNGQLMCVVERVEFVKENN